MNKFTLTIKSWWSSLFGKNKFEENNALSSMENINEIEALKEIEMIKMNEDSYKIEEPKKIEITQIDENSNKFEALKEIEITKTNDNNLGLPNTEAVYPLYDGKYDVLFSTPKIPIPLSVVDQELWDRIQSKLPENYIIPSPTSQYLYNTHSSKRI